MDRSYVLASRSMDRHLAYVSMTRHRDEMKLFMCHDYGPNGRAVAFETTVLEQRTQNIHVGSGQTREEFVEFRDARDATLSTPRLIIPSLQVNMQAGDIPHDEDGNPMLKVPLNKL